MRAILFILATLFALPVEAQIIRSPSGGAPVTSAQVDLSDFSYHANLAIFDATSMSAVGVLASSDTFGTASAINMTASLYGRFTRMRRTSATAVNSAAGFGTIAATSGTPYGQFAGQTSYTLTVRMGVPTGFVLGHRAFCGLYRAADSTITGATVFTAIPNVAYFGFDTTEATWRFCTHNSGGTRSCADTTHPIGTTGFYTFTFETVNGTAIDYKMTRDDLDPTTIIAQGSATTGGGFNMPAVTQEYRVACWVSTAAVGGNVIMEPSSIVYRLPYY